MKELKRSRDTKKAFDETKKLAYKAKDYLMQGSLEDFGKLLDKAWRMKKRFSPKISNPLIDDLYQTAKEAGALGGKISGAGGGGFMILYCNPRSRYKVAQSLIAQKAHVSQFSFEKDGLQTWRVD